MFSYKDIKLCKSSTMLQIGSDISLMFSNSFKTDKNISNYSWNFPNDSCWWWGLYIMILILVSTLTTDIIKRVDYFVHCVVLPEKLL